MKFPLIPVSISLAFLLLLTPRACAEDVAFGDPGMNGLDVADVVHSISLIIHAQGNVAPCLTYTFDVSPRHTDGTFGDGAITIGDTVALLRRLVGLEPAASWPGVRSINPPPIDGVRIYLQDPWYGDCSPDRVTVTEGQRPALRNAERQRIANEVMPALNAYLAARKAEDLDGMMSFYSEVPLPDTPGSKHPVRAYFADYFEKRTTTSIDYFALTSSFEPHSDGSAIYVFQPVERVIGTFDADGEPFHDTIAWAFRWHKEGDAWKILTAVQY